MERIMTIKELLRERRADIEKIAAKHGAFDIRVFGSVVRGEERKDSDIDLLVKTGAKTSPWFPGGLVADLEEILGRSVEVVTENGLNPLIREQVMKEATPL
jgi:predicted nucleotidyltransferase